MSASSLEDLFDKSRLFGTLERAESFVRRGKVVKATGLIVEATLPGASIGTACTIETQGGGAVPAEVVGFASGSALLMPVGELRGVAEGATVTPMVSADVPVGPGLLGRVVDAQMVPLDDGPRIRLEEGAKIHRAPPSPMRRRRVERPLTTGLRSLDSFLTLGEGQRIGIFAGAGVGKSSLLGMLARSADADVIVVALVGERGREVREFVERDLGPEGLARSVVVVATGDEAPLVRVRAALAATAVAESFRSRGQKVLLMMDSLTRVAMAQREIGLAAGEPPTSKGYPPSVFAELPKLLERAGNDEGRGSLTAIYTVLVEGDDLSDPIADAARAALDGHVVLSRKLASRGHFPAIDILSSVSRVFTDIVTPTHAALAREARELISTHQEAADLVDIGAYVHGTNPKIDRALALAEPLQHFLQQSRTERVALPATLASLAAALKPAGAIG